MKVTNRIFLILSTLWVLLETASSDVFARQTREERLSSEISFLNVTDFAQDKLGYMWISTLGGLNRYNGYEYEHFLHDPDDSLSLINDFVFSLKIDSRDNLWVGTAEELCLFNPDTDTFERFPGAVGIMDIFEDSRGKIWVATNSGPGFVDVESRRVVMMKDISCSADLIWEDSVGRIWLGLDEDRGIACIRDDGSVMYYPLPDGRHVKSIYKSPKGEWWLGTDRGMVIFSPISYLSRVAYDILPKSSDLYDDALNFMIEDSPMSVLIGTNVSGLFRLDLMTGDVGREDLKDGGPIESREISCCYIDSQSDVWIGTYDKGFSIMRTQNDDFNKNSVLDNGTAGQFISKVTEDRNGNLWAAVRLDGLFMYSPATRKSIFVPKEKLGIGKSDLIEELFVDSSDHLWVASEKSLIRVEVDRNGRMIGHTSIPFEDVRTINEDNEGNIFIGAQTGLFRSARGGGEFEKICDGTISDIEISASGDLYYSSYARGIYHLKEDLSSEIIVFSDEYVSPSGRAVTIFFDSSDRLWIGSYGFGLLCRDGDRILALDKDSGLPNNNVLCFVEDLDGGLWASTSKCIVKIRNVDGKLSCQPFFAAGKIFENQFHEKSGFLSSTGTVFFGGNHGLTFFNPSDVSSSDYCPDVIIEDLKILNRSVIPGEEGTPLERDIRNTDRIVLSHRQSSVSFDYSAIDFHSSKGLTYRYILEGFDKDWIEASDFRRATYSNLPAGEYVFKVVAVNGDGNSSSAPTSLQIKVRPSPWQSPVAVAIYILFLSAAVYLSLMTVYRMKMNQFQLEMERKEKELEREEDEMKTTFFTNISHEFRTPLTLIYAPLQKLVSDKDLSESQSSLVSTIDRNTRKLLQLVSQLLDFSKAEDGVLNLKVSYGDIIPAIRECTEVFLFEADIRKLKLDFGCPVESFQMYYDRDKLEKILNNLISNALKYTPKGGSVRVEFRPASIPDIQDRYGRKITGKAGNFIEISVIDNGVGIPEDKLNELFVRYRHIEGRQSDYSSNGIGLNYTKMLVEKHHGAISARNNPEGGMDFSFILPAEDVYTEDEKSKVVSDDSDGTVRLEKKPAPSGHGETILVVEDNVELRTFLVSMLASDYRVIPACDGSEAMDILESESVNMVLSDVIMPRMNGYELCSSIKSDSSLNHIPVVLLTAKTTVENQIEGLDSGADAYVCKPFNLDYLRHVISSIFANRILLRNYFIMPNVSERSLGTASSSSQKAFLDKLTNLIENELSDPDLNIDRIITELGYSRSAFYRKLKGLTGLAPNDFLREYRFKRAAEMILRGDASLVTISESTGFSSYSYFSKAFKTHFGMSPKAYSKSQGS